jgi:hypothetical protein
MGIDTRQSAALEVVPSITDIPARRLAEVSVDFDSVETVEGLKTSVAEQMNSITSRFLAGVAKYPRREPENIADRQTTLSFAEANAEDYRLGDWRPSRVQVYSSRDPWQESNPELTHVANSLIESTMQVAEQIKTSGTRDSSLTYLDAGRARGGRRSTVITSCLTSMSEEVADWMNGLPAAERLRPVANPWSDTNTVLRNKDGTFIEIPLGHALTAITGGSNDGRAVREREAWQQAVVRSFVDTDQLDDNKLRITSLGTGTGEPAMQTGLALVANAEKEGTVEVNGFDINENSLAIAGYIAEQKQQNLPDGSKLIFNGATTNILGGEGIAEAIRTTKPDIIESIGFSEYVPSANAPTPEEQKQRVSMERMGFLSAEEWYAQIYDSMPEGSVWLTGNMRTDSPQLSFVMNGIGWQGIIARSTEDYLNIIKDAGIPGEAVELYVPGEGSTGVYNLVAIRKPKKQQ